MRKAAVGGTKNRLPPLALAVCPLACPPYLCLPPLLPPPCLWLSPGCAPPAICCLSPCSQHAYACLYQATPCHPMHCSPKFLPAPPSIMPPHTCALPLPPVSPMPASPCPPFYFLLQLCSKWVIGGNPGPVPSPAQPSQEEAATTTLHPADLGLEGLS